MAERQFVSLKMDEHLFGIDILLVREIIREFAFTPVEHSLLAVQGLLNLRGQIITVLDPSCVLGMTPRELGPGSRCLILKTAAEVDPDVAAAIAGGDLGADAVGLIIDGVADVVTVDETEVDSPPANANGVDAQYLEGVVKLDDSLLLVLKVGGLLAGAGEMKVTADSPERGGHVLVP